MKWTRRFRERQDADARARVDWRGLVLMALTLFVIGFAYAYPRLNPKVRHDFDARIVEKYVAVGESLQGSVTLPRLVVESADGRRFTVGVSDEKYGQARVGMWLSRRDSELRLSSSEPGRGAPGGDGARFEAR